jgi:iron complex outermembrane receptor protein
MSFSGAVYRGRVQDVWLSVPFINPARSEDMLGEGKLSGHHLAVRWHNALSHGSISSELFYTFDQRNTTQVAIEQSILDAEIQYNTEIATHKLTLGAAVRRYEDAIDGSLHIQFQPPSVNDEIYHLFAYDQWSMTETLALTAGIKFEDLPSQSFEVLPKLGVQLVTDQGTFWAQIEQAVRTPSRLEKHMKINYSPVYADQFYSGQPEGFFQLQGNPDYQTEILTAYEMGFRQFSSDRFHWEMSWFVNDYDQLILLETEHNLGPAFIDDRGQYIVPFTVTQNAYGITRGFEWSANWQVNENNRVTAHVSYLDMDLKGSEAAKVANRRSPRFQLQLRTQHKLPDNWSLSTLIHHSDAVESTNDAIESYTKVDIRVGRQIQHQYEWFFGVKNLLEKNHLEHFSPGRNVNAYIERQFFIGFNYLVQ